MKNIIVVIICICALLIFAQAVKKNSRNVAVSLLADAQPKKCTVILDAGHGGEDGGAVAKDGTLEKDLNLQISICIADYFEIFGIDYIPVRTADVSVGDNSLATLRQRKVSDIKTREALVNSTDNAVFLSIHQNMFEQAKYYGTQVFYSSNDSSSGELAEKIRLSVVDKLQPQNTRQCKPSGSSIYLLYNAKTTAVLVECGFLSNEDERSKLKDGKYQNELSYCIVTGLLNYLYSKEDV